MDTGTWRPDPTPCPDQECRCHIGYVHAPGLPAHAHFGEGILERIPRGPASGGSRQPVAWAASAAGSKGIP